MWYRGSRFGFLLVPLAWIYRVLLNVHRRRARRQRSPVPVVVVGNLTVGGTGKTPVVIWIVEQLRARGFSPGVVTRGYLGTTTAQPRSVTAESAAQEVGDEAVLLAQRLGCPVTAGARRLDAIRHLVANAPVDVVVSDDGLQHFALQPDCSIVVIDGRRGLGNGRLLPAGPLREPAARLGAVDLVLVNGPGFAHDRSLQFELRATTLRQLSDGRELELEAFAGRAVHAVAGIGNPERFFAMLRRAGCRVDAHALGDHAEIRTADLRFADGAPVLITQKDAVKCGRDVPDGVWYVAVEVEFAPAAQEQIMQTVTDRIADAAADR